MKNLIRKLMVWGTKNIDLLVIIIATWVTWIGNPEMSTSVHAVINESKMPEAIFTNYTNIDEFIDGQLKSVIKKYANYDIILLYIYANWDAESLQYCDKFAAASAAAESLQLQVPFVAINCWVRTSECFKHFNIVRYPKIFSMIRSQKFVEYFNEIEPSELLDYIEKLRYPFLFPHNESDIVKNLLTSDGLLVFCLNSTSKSFHQKINVIHEVASILQGEGKVKPILKVAVISLTDPSFDNFHSYFNTPNHPFFLLSFNRDRVLYRGNMIASDIIEFVQSNSAFNRAAIGVRQFISLGIKTKYVQNFLKNGITLFLVIKNKMKEFSPKAVYSTVVYELAAHYYYNCQNSTSASLLMNYWYIKLDNLLLGIRSRFEKYYRKASNVTHFLPDSYRHLDNVNWLCGDQFNRSLFFLTVDSADYSKLLNNLGVANQDVNMSSIVVVDWKNEKVHKLEQEMISENMLQQLLQQIVMNNITNHLVSQDHHYRTRHVNVTGDHLFRPMTLTDVEEELGKGIRDLVLFYYTPWCCYCTTLLNVLVMLAHYFRDYPNIIFGSIDTFQNDLPYKYQSEHVPAFIMYPQGSSDIRKAYVFSLTEKHVTLSRLVQFVLLHSGDPMIQLNGRHHQDQQQQQQSSAVAVESHCGARCLSTAIHIITLMQHKLRRHLSQTQVKFKDLRQSLISVCSSSSDHYYTSSSSSISCSSISGGSGSVDSQPAGAGSNLLDWIYRTVLIRKRRHQQSKLIASLRYYTNRKDTLLIRLSKFDSLSRAFSRLLALNSTIANSLQPEDSGSNNIYYSNYSLPIRELVNTISKFSVLD